MTGGNLNHSLLFLSTLSRNEESKTKFGGPWRILMAAKIQAHLAAMLLLLWNKRVPKALIAKKHNMLTSAVLVSRL